MESLPPGSAYEHLAKYESMRRAHRVRRMRHPGRKRSTPTMTRCETIRVLITHPDEGMKQLTVPAYTVAPIELAGKITDAVIVYLTRATAENQPMSMGDFACYMLTVASEDPREQ